MTFFKALELKILVYIVHKVGKKGSLVWHLLSV